MNSLPMKTPVLTNQSPLPLKKRAWVEATELRVMGIDPGLATTGIAVLGQAQGQKPRLLDLVVLSTQKASKKERRNLRVATDDKRRFTAIWGGMAGLAAKFEIHALAIEVFSPWQVMRKQGSKAVGGGFSSAWKTASVYGLGLGFGFSRDLLTFPFLPADLKRAIVGKLAATKEDVCVALLGKVDNFKELLKKIPDVKREHAADAVGHAYLGLCELYELRKMLGLQS